MCGACVTGYGLRSCVSADQVSADSVLDRKGVDQSGGLRKGI